MGRASGRTTGRTTGGRPWGRTAAPAAAYRAAAGGAGEPPIKATRVGREVGLACATGGRTGMRPPGVATSSCGPPTWPRVRMAALWQRSLRAERGRGCESVHSAIPYRPYQLTTSRAITPIGWRKYAVPGQLTQRYSIAVPAVDESTRENVTGQAGLAAATRGGRRRPLVRLERATSTCGHIAEPRSDVAVDIDGRGSSDWL